MQTPAKTPELMTTDARMEREVAPEADTEAAYIRACGEAYHRHGFSFRPAEQTSPGSSLLINSLTLPEPQNAVQRTALTRYLDAWEQRTGVRPEVIFQAVQTPEPKAAPPAAEHSRWTGEPLGAGKGQSHR